MRCENGQHVATSSDETSGPCDHRVVLDAEFKHSGLGVCLSWHYGHYSLEAVAHRERDGKPWFPSVDEDFLVSGSTETEAQAAFTKMVEIWAACSREDVDEWCV